MMLIILPPKPKTSPYVPTVAKPSLVSIDMWYVHVILMGMEWDGILGFFLVPGSRDAVPKTFCYSI